MAIKRETILDAALAILDEAGIDQLTTRRIAERLSVQQPALYWHFKSKADLLDAMNERIMRVGHTRRMPRRGETWQTFVAENARSFRRSLLAHRDGARIHAGTKPVASDIAGLEAQLRIYLDAGFDPMTALEAGIAIGRYVVGCVLEEQADGDRPFDPASFLEVFEGYPLLQETLRPHLNEPHEVGNETAFESGLSMFIAGLEAKLAETRRRRDMAGNQTRTGQVRKGMRTRTPKRKRRPEGAPPDTS